MIQSPGILATVSKIRVGMSRVEVRRLLGGPASYQAKQLGLVRGPDAYTTNRSADPQTLRERGFRDYLFEQWSSPEVSIMVVSDMEGRVVCRYSGKGQTGVNWVWVVIERVKRWVTKTVTAVL
jgi:hypothetical protein